MIKKNYEAFAQDYLKYLKFIIDKLYQYTEDNTTKPNFLFKK